MKISNVKAVLTEEDILSIIEDYLSIEGLTIESVEIKEVVTVKGNYKKKIKIPFKAKIGIGNIDNNTLNIKVFSVNILKIGVLSNIKNLLLKKLLSDYDEYGIKVEKDNVSLNLDLISKLVPYFYVKLRKINLMDRSLEVEVTDIVYAENKEIVKITKKIKTNDKYEDKYSKIRGRIVDRVPDKYEKALQYAMLIPDITALLWRVFKDKRVKIKVKMMVVGVIFYLVSPIDVIPDFIPFIGAIDDIAIAFFGLNAIINEVPEEIILENWTGNENIILITKEAVNYISKVVGSDNVNKLLISIKKVFKAGERKVKEENLKNEFAVTVQEAAAEKDSRDKKVERG
jgi:uncharacterized membrane protein YkvA (DUF1232 family)